MHTTHKPITTEERQTEHKTLLMRSFPPPRVRSTMHASLSWNKLGKSFLLSSENHLRGPRLLLFSFIQLPVLSDIKQEERTSGGSLGSCPTPSYCLMTAEKARGQRCTVKVVASEFLHFLQIYE